MAKGYVRATEDGDAESLAPRLREPDLADIRAQSGRTPLDVLRDGYEYSTICCTIIGCTGRAEGMFGINDEGIFGRVWLLGTDDLVKKPLVIQFLREGRGYLEVLERPYDLTGNRVVSTNTVHIRWLKYMGYMFIKEHIGAGLQGETIVEFVKLIHRG